MSAMFFDGWEPVVRTLVVGVSAYVGLVFLLRISGKRTLSKMNAFDFVVTVSLGSTLASVLTSSRVSLAQGLTALGLLIGMQYVVTWASVRVSWFKRLVTGEPTLIFHDGAPLPGAMRRTRVTEAELRSAARSSGLPTLDHVAAIVLETDGSFTLIPRDAAGADQAARTIRVEP